MTEANDPYAEFSTSSLGAPEDKLATAKSLAVEMIAAERNVANATDALTKAKAALADIQERRLPALMGELELPSFVTIDPVSGAKLKISIDETIRVSIPSGGKSKGKPGPDNRPAAFAYFREIGEAGCIKKELQANLGLRGDNEAKAVLDDFRNANPGVDVKLEEWVEPATVTSVIKKRLLNEKSDPPVPLDVFSVFRQTVAKVEVS